MGLGFSLGGGGGSGGGGGRFPASVVILGSLDASLAANLPASPSDGDTYDISVAGDFQSDAAIAGAGVYFEQYSTLTWHNAISLWVKGEYDNHMTPNGEAGSILNFAGVFTSDPSSPTTGDMWLIDDGASGYYLRVYLDGGVRGIGF